MTHRAEQIGARIVAIHTAANFDRAELHRATDYDPGTELPAVSVEFGADLPPAESNIPIIDSVLTVSVILIVSAATEVDVVSQLMELRTRSHIALMADRTLGIPDVVGDVAYGGASAPIIEKPGEKLAGRMETTWLVRYRMNLLDPQ